MSLPTPRAVKIIAKEHGYVERREEVSSTLFFKDNKPNNPNLINVFYTTGGVMTKLSHPRSGYNELWRSDAYNSAEGLSSIFANPRVHTGQGYRHAGDAKRGCTKCGMQKKKGEYSKNQWRKGAGNAKCTSCTQQGQQGRQSRGGGDAASSIKCKSCGSLGRFCALNNEGTEFYCSESCMASFLQESEPPFFDLQSPTLNVRASEGCSIKTISLDDAFCVAGEHMPHINSVDIYIDQGYLLFNDSYMSYMDHGGKNILLSPGALEDFFEKVKTKLVSFSFRLDQCCEEEIKSKTDRCRSFLPLGTMPNLKKLTLSHFGFDDVNTLTSCLSPRLRALNLNSAKMGCNLEWSTTESDAFVFKLSQLRGLVSLNIADSAAITDRHLKVLLPHLKEIRILDVSARFGTRLTNNWNVSELTDDGMKAIADNCPKILGLFVSFQRNITIDGFRALLQKCPDLLALEAGDVPAGTQHVAEIVSTAKNLLFFLCGITGERHAESAMHNAMRATKGRVAIVTMSGGLVRANLSPMHQRNLEETKAIVERANAQEDDPMIYNKWEGILEPQSVGKSLFGVGGR